jgi:hypothetical protein
VERIYERQEHVEVGKTANGRLLDVGILEDGSLHNPNGYPEDEVRSAVEAANERRHQRRSKAAKRAAETRRQRKERLVYELVERLKKGGHLQPSTHRIICKRQLDDPESLARGIGRDC